MDLEYNSVVSEPCACDGKGPHLVRCVQCPDMAMTCTECFVARHKPMWTHRAEVWNNAKQYFEKKSISDLSGSFTPQLGHNGDPCPMPGAPVKIIVVDVHGIHNVRLRFCDCDPTQEHPRFEQLLRCRLFPSTTTRPGVAFSFEWLRHFQLIHTEGALSTSAMMAAWQRITDNTYPWSVAVSLHSRCAILYCE